MSKVSIIVRSEKGKNGFPLQLYVKYQEKKLRFGIGISIRNKRDLICNQIINEPDKIPCNITLAGIVSQTELFLLNKPTLPDVVAFCNSLLSKPGNLSSPKKERKLVDVLDEFVSIKSNPSTITNYGITRKKIIAFDASATLETVDRKWLSGIEAMMRNSGMSINGLAIRLRDIRAVFNYAIDEEYTTNYPFRKFRIKQEQTAKRCLSKETLTAIRDYVGDDYWNNNSVHHGFMEEYRDMFMLMFYLIGINASDLFTLPATALKNGRIVYYRKKTGKLYSIKIEPEAMAIINRYKGSQHLLCPLDRYGDYRDYLHHMNDGLKNLGRRFKDGIGWSGKAICPALTSYYSRHTWATIAFDIGIPKDIISLALGHSFGVSVTDTYIEYSTKQVDEANRKVLDYINK